MSTVANSEDYNEMPHNVEQQGSHKAYQRETTVSSNDSLPFQNENFSYRKEFAPRGSELFPLRAF